MDVQLARVVGLVVVVFLLLNMPRVYIGMFEFSRIFKIMFCYKHEDEDGPKYMSPQWQLLMDLVARYLAVLNSSVNFCLYCMMNRQFRTELYEILSFLKREGAAPVTVMDRAMSPNVPDKMSPVKSTRTLLVPSSPNVCPENGFLETNF